MKYLNCIWLLLAFCFSSSLCSQVPLVDYKPVVIEQTNNFTPAPLVSYKPVIVGRANSYETYSNTNSNGSDLRQGKTNVVTIVGYTYNPKTNNYKKAKIRIEKVLGSLYLNSIYNGNTGTWHTAGGSVYKIDKQYGSEPEFIRDNFDWKVVTAVVGTIYFNY